MGRKGQTGVQGGQQDGAMHDRLLELCGEIDAALLDAADAAGEEYPALDVKFLFDYAVQVYCAELIGDRGRARRADPSDDADGEN